MSSKIKSCTLHVSGTHCHSCELLIEKEIKTISGIKSVVASSTQGTVKIEYNQLPPDIAKLNHLFKESGYLFSTSPNINPQFPAIRPNILISLTVSFLIIGAFLLINRLGLFSFVEINSQSFLPVFFLFGLLAGFSTCAALVGGLVLSLGQQWGSSLRPSLLFNFGRLISFTAFGAILGSLGSIFQLSLTAGSLLTIIISLLMVALAFQMLGLPGFKSLGLVLPKSLTSKISDESNFRGRWLPLLAGALTFFLPCGFTLTAQSLALASGSFINGGLIMLFFVLGTSIPLFLISLANARFRSKPSTSAYFSQIAGLLVFAFALFNILNQLTVLGIAPIFSSNSTNTSNLPIQNNGLQIIKMDASSAGYTPNQFTVKAGIPVRWEITNLGISGCTNAILAPQIFDGPLNINTYGPTIKEFTISKPGTYRFSCWMGMISGTITAVP